MAVIPIRRGPLSPQFFNVQFRRQIGGGEPELMPSTGASQTPGGPTLSPAPKPLPGKVWRAN
jgi:hypothetical protein